MRMAPQVSLVSDDGIDLHLSLFAFPKPDTENGPELQGKSERSELNLLCSLHTSVFVQKVR